MNIGVEIEFTGIDRYSVALAIHNVLGQRLVTCKKHRNNPDYPDDCPKDFEAYRVYTCRNKKYYITRDISIDSLTSDKSVSGVVLSDKNKYDFKNEVVTPVLNTDNISDMNELRDILTVIKAVGGVSNNSCGLHIHVDRPRDIVSVFKKWIILQNDWVRCFEPYEPRMNKYAKLYRNVDEYDINCTGDIFDYIKAEYGDDASLRRFALNFDALNLHNTLEFRLFNGTLEYDTIMRYISAIDEFMRL